MIDDFNADNFDPDLDQKDEDEEVMKRKFDDFFSSESDDIEQDLLDNDNEDSMSDHSDNSADQLSPRSFELAIQEQKKDNLAKL